MENKQRNASESNTKHSALQCRESGGGHENIQVRHHLNAVFDDRNRNHPFA